MASPLVLAALPPPSGGKAAVYSVAFSPAASLIASGSKDRTVRLWLPTVCVPPARTARARLAPSQSTPKEVTSRLVKMANEAQSILDEQGIEVPLFW